jgi:glycine/D-amino acid oxidase-like deaminating enzyme
VIHLTKMLQNPVAGVILAPVTPPYVDVLIVGAGLSGIGAACRLQTDAPGTSYAIVEARGASGGTWDQFRFPHWGTPPERAAG